MDEHLATRPAATGGDSAPSIPGVSLLVVLLLVLAGVAYANAIDHPFLYDDLPLVLNNPEIRSLSNVPRILGFSDGGFEFRGRWTRGVTHAVEYAIGGPNPALYHATNVALHALMVGLAFAVIAAAGRDRMLAWWSAAIVAVHPINTEVVAHVSGRRDLLAAIFSLATLWLLLAHVRRGGWWRLGLAVVTLFLGVSSKEFALLTPAAFVLLHVYARWRDPAGSVKGFLAEAREALVSHRASYAVLALVTVGLVALLLSANVVGGLSGSPGFYETTTEGLGVVDHARVMGLALRLFLVPVGQSVDYSFDALGLVGGGLSPLAVVDLAILIMGAFATIVGLARRSWAGFAGCWFLIYFLPYIGFIPWHETFAERFLYLPGLGLATGLAAGGLSVARRLAASGRVVWRPATAFGLAVLAVLTVGTLSRNRVWADGLALWSDAAERYPNCARARYGLADALLMDTRAAQAQAQFQAAADILPGYVEARLGIALSLAAQMRLQQAREHVVAVLDEHPHEPRALNMLGYMEEALGNMPRAEAAYQQAVDEDPTFTEGYNNLAKLRVLDGDLEGAIALYERALEYDPACLPALVNLGVVYREGLKDEERAAIYEERARTLRRFQR